MRTEYRARWGLLVGLVGVVAAAQETEAEEYRPALAVLEVVASDLASIERAQQLELALLSMLEAYGQFAVTAPAQLREEHPELDRSCDEPACLETALERLRVQRAARITVEQYDGGSRVTLLGLDSSSPLVEPVRTELEVEDDGEELEPLIPRTPAARDLEFLARVLPRLRLAFDELATPNGKLVVESADPAVPVLIGGKPAGLGRVEVIRPPGQVLVSLGGTFYEPSDRVVTVRPGEVTSVELRLVARAVTPPLVVHEPQYAGLMSKPGVYLSMTGITLLGVGAGLGIATLVMQERLAQPGVPLPVTRLEAMNAPAQAVLANFLIATGATLTVGGIGWVALTPTKKSLVADEPAMPGEAQGWTLSLGGKL